MSESPNDLERLPLERRLLLLQGTLLLPAPIALVLQIGPLLIVLALLNLALGARLSLSPLVFAGVSVIFTAVTAGVLAGLDAWLVGGVFTTDTLAGVLSLLSSAVLVNNLMTKLMSHGGLVDEVVEARLKKERQT